MYKGKFTNLVKKKLKLVNFKKFGQNGQIQGFSSIKKFSKKFKKHHPRKVRHKIKNVQLNFSSVKSTSEWPKSTVAFFPGFERIRIRVFEGSSKKFSIKKATYQDSRITEGYMDMTSTLEGIQHE